MKNSDQTFGIIQFEVLAGKNELTPSNGPIVNVKQSFALDSWAYNVKWNKWIVDKTVIQ